MHKQRALTRKKLGSSLEACANIFNNIINKSTGEILVSQPPEDDSEYRKKALAKNYQRWWLRWKRNKLVDHMKFYKIKGDCFHILVFKKRASLTLSWINWKPWYCFIQLKFWRIEKKKCWGPIYAIWQVSVSTASTAP